MVLKKTYKLDPEKSASFSCYLLHNNDKRKSNHLARTLCFLYTGPLQKSITHDLIN